jgi:hypothetical protein
MSHSTNFKKFQCVLKDKDPEAYELIKKRHLLVKFYNEVFNVKSIVHHKKRLKSEHDKLSVYYFIKPKRVSKNGLCPIYGRITLNGIRKELAIKQKIDLANWDQTTQRAIGEEYQKLNLFLDTFKINVKNSVIINVTVLKTVTEMLEQKEKIIGSEITQARMNRFLVAERKLIAFLREHRKKDVNIRSVNKNFMTQFEQFLIETGCAKNTANMYIKIIKMAIKPYEVKTVQTLDNKIEEILNNTIKELNH